MIGITWLQHRLQAIVSIIVLVMLVLFLLVTGLAVISYYQTNIVSCMGTSNVCPGIIFDRFGQYIKSLHVQDILQSVPALVGLFIGGPLLASEVERGTYLLAWTQGVTRQRWLAVKLILFAVATLAAFLLLELFVIWWNGPVVSALGPFTDFDISGVVPFVYALFALVLGITAGIIVRNSVGAIAVTLALFAGLRVLVYQVRPLFLPTLTAQLSPDGQLGVYRQDWIVNTDIINLQGHSVASNPCAHSVQTDCLQSYGLHILITYHPVSQFWMLQSIESVIFLLLTAGLCGLMFWWIQHRVH